MVFGVPKTWVIKMLGQYLITFREVLEAALITSIILAYFIRTDKKHLTGYIWTGIIIALVVSVGIAVAVAVLYGGLSSAGAKLFEGIAALLAVLVLTSMILWMALKAGMIKEELNARASLAVKKGTVISIISLSFIVVFREGFETVLFLIPFGASDASGTIAGAALGIVSALVISYLIFRVGIKLNLTRFFYFTSILLILLAAGLLGYGVHELISYSKAVGGDPGFMGQYAFDLGLESGSLLHHKGAVGSILAVMFGYSVKMEWARIIVHGAYLAVFLPITALAYKSPESLDWLRNSIDKLNATLGKIIKSKTESPE